MLLAGMKRPLKALISISHLGEREKTLGRICSLHSISSATAAASGAERTGTRSEVAPGPSHYGGHATPASLLGGRKIHRS